MTPGRSVLVVLLATALASVALSSVAANTVVDATYRGHLYLKYHPGYCDGTVCPAPQMQDAERGWTYNDHAYVSPANRFTLNVEASTAGSARVSICALDAGGLPFQCWQPASAYSRPIPSGAAGFRVMMEAGTEARYVLKLTH